MAEQSSVEKRYMAVSKFYYLAWKTNPSGASALAVANPNLVKPAKTGDEIVGNALVMKRFTPAGIKDSQVVRISTTNHGYIYAPMEALKLAGSKPSGSGSRARKCRRIAPDGTIIAYDCPTSSNFSGADGSTSVPPIVTVLPSILSSVGFIWGLSYAFSKQKGFWAYVGYSFLGSIGGAAAGGLVKVVAYPESFSGADGVKKKKWSLFKSKVKGSCTCPDGQRYPCTGERSCNECCHKFLD